MSVTCKLKGQGWGTSYIKRVNIQILHSDLVELSKYHLR